MPTTAKSTLIVKSKPVDPEKVLLFSVKMMLSYLDLSFQAHLCTHTPRRIAEIPCRTSIEIDSAHHGREVASMALLKGSAI